MDHADEPDRTRPLPAPVAPHRPRTVDVGAVLGGLVLLAVAAAVTARQLTGSTWDWRWSAAGVLLLSGLCLVLAAVVAAARQGQRAADRRRPAGRRGPR